jgi:predicted membrane protein
MFYFIFVQRKHNNFLIVASISAFLFLVWSYKRALFCIAYVFPCMVYCFFLFQECWMCVRTRLDNVTSAESEEVAEEETKQQKFGEGKCPLT